MFVSELCPFGVVTFALFVFSSVLEKIASFRRRSGWTQVSQDGENFLFDLVELEVMFQSGNLSEIAD